MRAEEILTAFLETERAISRVRGGSNVVTLQRNAVSGSLCASTKSLTTFMELEVAIRAGKPHEVTERSVN